MKSKSNSSPNRANVASNHLPVTGGKLHQHVARLYNNFQGRHPAGLRDDDIWELWFSSPETGEDHIQRYGGLDELALELLDTTYDRWIIEPNGSQILPNGDIISAIDQLKKAGLIEPTEPVVNSVDGIAEEVLADDEVSLLFQSACIGMSSHVMDLSQSKTLLNLVEKLVKADSVVIRTPKCTYTEREHDWYGACGHCLDGYPDFFNYCPGCGKRVEKVE